MPLRAMLGTVLSKGIHEVEVVEAGLGRGRGRDITIIVQGEVAHKARISGRESNCIQLECKELYTSCWIERKEEKYRRGKTRLYL